MSLYELVLDGRYQNQQIINRFNYISSGSPGGVSGSFALAKTLGFDEDGYDIPGLDDTFIHTMALLQTSLFTYVEAIVKNPYDVTDFFTMQISPPLAGIDTVNTGMSPTSAVGFRTNRVRQDIARGTKRIAGVVETGFTTGGVLESAYLALAENLADAMSANLVSTLSGGSITFTPCVCKKEKYHPTGKTTWAYRYFPTESEQLENVASGIIWTPYDRQRTQTSRQVGRGS